MLGSVQRAVSSLSASEAPATSSSAVSIKLVIAPLATRKRQNAGRPARRHARSELERGAWSSICGAPLGVARAAGTSETLTHGRAPKPALYGVIRLALGNGHVSQ